LEAVFEILNLTGEKVISVMDIVELCSYFEKETPLGHEVHSMLEEYKNKNLRTRIQQNKVQYDVM
jgi:hypothetical protein